ncbi:MAG: hypothetical protein IPK83_12525 [Planctomycetes bacterium]|nr:hypothetical protein [Planctomycetota bacterium]
MFDIDRTTVKWQGNNKDVTIIGEIGLPSGVDYSELSPTATALLEIANITVAPTTTYNFNTSGNNDQKWKYTNNAGPVTKFEIDWDGARFKFADCFPIDLKSTFITSSETVLEVKYQRNQLGGPVVININGQATINIDANGYLTSTAPYEIDKPRKAATVTLPFPLQDSSVITISGGVSKAISVGEYLRGSVGRFRIDSKIDGAMFPNGKNTMPRTLDLSVTIGTEHYPGADHLSASELDIQGNNWKFND